MVEISGILEAGIVYSQQGPLTKSCNIYQPLPPPIIGSSTFSLSDSHMFLLFLSPTLISSFTKGVLPLLGGELG